MTGRQIFHESEKLCLQELIIKYKLNSTATIGAGNANVKKIAWRRLTEEFNSYENNNKRTESQLKKCWDNLKTRRKETLALEKRERMKTGGGPIAGTSQGSQDSIIDTALQDLTDVEMQFVTDSDSVQQSIDIEVDSQEIFINAVDEVARDKEPGASASHEQDGSVQPGHARVPRQSPPRRGSGSRLADYASQSQTPARVPRQSPPRRGSGSRLADYASQSQTPAARNVRAHVVTEEFNLRKENYRHVYERDEQLHKLKIAEREWLVKAAEEQYHKARLERESAEEVLLCNRAKREEKELKLNILRNKNDNNYTQ